MEIKHLKQINSLSFIATSSIQTCTINAYVTTIFWNILYCMHAILWKLGNPFVGQENGPPEVIKLSEIAVPATWCSFLLCKSHISSLFNMFKQFWMAHYITLFGFAQTMIQLTWRVVHHREGRTAKETWWLGEGDLWLLAYKVTSPKYCTAISPAKSFTDIQKNCAEKGTCLMGGKNILYSNRDMYWSVEMVKITWYCVDPDMYTVHRYKGTVFVVWYSILIVSKKWSDVLATKASRYVTDTKLICNT